MASGKKYGLIITSKKTAAATKKVTKPSIFGESSDEEDSGVGSSFWKDNKKRSKQIESHESVTKALAEDPNIFEYDNVYDEMQEEKKKADPRLKKKDTKSKYISHLKKMAERRKLEQDIVYERKVQREMEREEGDFKDKDTFLTSAYRKKLEERRQMEEELRREDALEAANDVKKQKDLSKFHRNLLNQMAPSSHGQSRDGGKRRSSTDREQREEKEERQRRMSERDERSSRDGHREEKRSPHRTRRHSDRSPERRISQDSRRSPPRGSKHLSTSDKERTPEPEKQEESKLELLADTEDVVATPVEEKADQTSETVRLPTKEDLEEKRRVVAAKRTNTEALESARDRYLARKRAKLSAPVVAADD